MDIDYKLLKALNSVVQQQSFENASSDLNISQSAVSQRIKLLEEFVGHPVLIRSKPLTLTDIGHSLINHYKQVELLERDLLPNIKAENPQGSIRLSLSVNADSLSIWFIDALSPLLKRHPIELDIHVLDENRTTQKLKSGEAFGALSTQPNPLSGYKADYVGDLVYVLVCSPEYRTKHFSDGVNQKSLKFATGVVYDQLDKMHLDFIKQEFDMPHGSYPCHHVRSSEAFVDLAKNSVAYALLPELQIRTELATGKLVNLLPKTTMASPLYWHSWILGKGIFKQASEMIVEYALKRLPANN